MAMRVVVGVALLMLVVCVPALADSKCWVDLGKKDYFGSEVQVAQLKQMSAAASIDECPRYGFTWELEIGKTVRQTYVLHDRVAHILYRTKSENVMGFDMGVRWSMWQHVDDQNIVDVDPSLGMDFDGTRYGNGGAPLSEVTALFLLEALSGDL